jgi:hypothetical protein
VRHLVGCWTSRGRIAAAADGCHGRGERKVVGGLTDNRSVAIDWTYLGSLGGEGVENFVAACLRQRYPDAIQTRPAQGDGGIDIYRETPAGLIVWQVKKFTAPLTPPQKQNVKKTWNRFWDSSASGRPVAHYYLVTPWTPTDTAMSWFKNDLTVEAGFPTQWDGAAFFNGLAADYPAIFDRFVKGPGVLDSLVTAKAVLASSPVESDKPATMLEAIRLREDAIRDLRDMVIDEYFVNSGTISTRDGSLPLPGPNDAGVLHRYESLGEKRFRVESVVPKSDQSIEIAPIRLQVGFKVSAGSADAKKIEDWRAWGIPFKDVVAEVRNEGGPLAAEAPSDGLVSFVLEPAPRERPGIELRVADSDGSPAAHLLFGTVEVTRGIEGGGTRIVAEAPSKAVSLELRFGSALQPDDTQISITPARGQNPARVRDDLTVLDSIRPDDTFEIVIEGGLILAQGSAFTGIPMVKELLQIAAALAELQGSSIKTFTIPDPAGVNRAQVEWLDQLVDIYRGNALTTTWSRLMLPAGEMADHALAAKKWFSLAEQPTFKLGSDVYQVTKRFVRSYLSPRLAADTDAPGLTAGDMVAFEPGDDPRLIVAMVRDDTISGE